MSRTAHGRRWAASAAGLALVVTGLGVTGVAAAPPAPQAPSPSDKVAQEVRDQLADKGSTQLWVRFADRPDMNQFADVTDWDARGQAVYDALTKTAEESQADVRSQLDDAGLSYETFWASNAIVVDGDEDLLTSLAGSPEVEGIYAAPQYVLPELEVGETENAPAAIEWGIDNVNADDVWSTYGVRGEGVVVGLIDSGTEFDHPALVEQYRGNQGGGTFEHNYSWFDAAGTSPDAPDDTNGHGTHVTGTMVGDDGGENQIGVAPGAQWISANGCCPSDTALIASGEWMLAPTDLEGENPMPSMRPHVVNNSWGTVAPSNDPFMVDVSQAWAAAGIFGVWANGNSGTQGCESSGSPGSLEINYSVGNYDINNVLADSSGKGVGENGVIKPNISAPGTNVRSSVPGAGYANFTGTSMASPHTAGAIALMWSAAPGLIGDIEGTAALLDGSARDTEDLTCGGTAEDNNYYGEGRLDAFALVESAPVGDTGTLEGTVTEAATGEPVEGATVEVVGDLERTVTTDEAGQYSVLLTAGDYDVTASFFGYADETATVTVPAGGSVTQDFAMQAVESATVTGTVTDGSGYGFPLYTKVSVDGTPVTAYTDPEEGTYSLEVPVGGTYTMSYQVQYPGYVTETVEATVTGDAVVDVAVPVSVESCIAPGYAYVTEGVSESFDDLVLPEGWTVVDLTDPPTGQVWEFDDPGGRGNLTGGEGGFAVLDSDEYGNGGQQNTALISPPIDMSGLDSPAVGFKQDFNYLSGESANVDVSIDGGATWETMLTQATDVRGPNEQFVQLPMAAGQTDVHVRFHYLNGSWDWWWQVDDVFVGNRDCLPTGEGGYVVGTVSSAETGEGIVGASVVNLGDEEESATTQATPDDENLADGFYWMFSDSIGATTLQASATNHETATQDVTVVDSDAVRADFALGSGLLEVDPASIETTVEIGESDTREMTITNTGSGTADVELSEVEGDFEILRADGSQQSMAEARDSAGAEPVRIAAEVSFAQFGTPSEEAAEPNHGAYEEPWTDLTAYPAVVMDGRVVNLDGTWYTITGGSGSASYDTVFRYDNATMEWVEVAGLPSPRNAVATGAVDGQIVVTGGWVAAGPTAETLVYDPAADTWTPVADNPNAVSAAGQAVVDGRLYSVGGCTTSACTPMSSAAAAYDVASDTWTEIADYPVAAAFISCGGVDGMVYCTGGNTGTAALADSYVFDPEVGTWTPLPDAPVDSWASQYAAANGHLIVNGGVQGGLITNETFAYDVEGGAWIDLPASNYAVYRGGAACGFGKVGGDIGSFTAQDDVELLPGFDDCGDAGADVPWLSLSTYEATVPAGESVTVEVTTDGDVPQPGAYTASVRVQANTPQTIEPVSVTMSVVPPLSWGKLLGTVTGADCDGLPAVLAGATVDVDPLNESHSGWTLLTDDEGGYAAWIDSRVGELEVIAAQDGYRPESALVTLVRSGEVVQDFLLRLAGCEGGPEPIHPEVERMAGLDRYQTAAVVSQEFAPGVSTVFVATGATYPDALTAAARAGSLGGPVLLTRPDGLPGATAQELDRLEPQRVVVLGGERAIQDPVIDQIRAAADDAVVTRLAGTDRYQTAALIAQEFDSADMVYVATGLNYPDALSAAALAGAQDAPVLLTRPDALPAASAFELDRLSPDSIVLLGGEEAISEDVQTELEEWAQVERLAGETRFDTSALVAQAWGTNDRTYVASGRDFPDALAAAAVAGHQDAPVLIVEQDSVPDVIMAELERLEPGWIGVVGGEMAIDQVVIEELEALE